MAGRPKDGGQPLTSLSIRISPEMKAELEARARRQRRTTSDYVKLLLEKGNRSIIPCPDRFL